MKHQELTRRIIGTFFDVYNDLGHGFLESVYVEALSLALRESGLRVEREMPLNVHFHGQVVGSFRADLVVCGAVLVETKACQCIHAAHNAQALNYLRATVLEVALVLNFGPKPGLKRLVFDNQLKGKSLGLITAAGAAPEMELSAVPDQSVSVANFSLATPA